MMVFIRRHLVALLVFLLFTSIVYAAPAKDYLSAAQIRNLLDQLSALHRVEDVNAMLGEPSEIDSTFGYGRWAFDDGEVQMSYDAGIVSELTIVATFPSSLERDRMRDAYLKEFETFFGKPYHTGNAPIWSWNARNGFRYELSTVSGELREGVFCINFFSNPE